MTSSYAKKAQPSDAGYDSVDNAGDTEFGSGSMIDEAGEAFGRGYVDVDFCTVEWLHAAMTFLKVIFATGVLSIPSVMFDSGAVPGSLVLVAFTVLNGYRAIIQGKFRKQRPGCY
ncbi:uncharacterized protein BDV17DRAFT_295823 [Aspergillus undulatus]|uniref:uncharacterized protein n=1 Tax=Aspergillus undulatus TaxID=1810928 RepID=UPI003CCE2C3C